MSSITSLSPSSTLQFIATVTVTASPTIQTVTITPPPPEQYTDYSDDAFGGLSTMNVYIFLASMMVAAMIGFNRLVAIPIIASIAGAIDNGLEWYTYGSQYSLEAKRISSVFADLAWGTQDAVLTLYSFFLLEKILRGKQRIGFMATFCLLFTSFVALRLAITGLHVKALDDGAIYDTINKITRWYFLIIAVTECLSAVFLLRVFYAARRGASTLGVSGNPISSSLFAQLAHSSEVRVATLAMVGVTRAVCFGFDDRIHLGFDRAAYIMENAFPIALLVDLLTSRVTKLQATVNSRGYGNLGSRGNPVEKSGGSGSRHLSGALGTSASAEGKFPVYVAKGWSVSTVTAPGVATVDEVQEDIEMEANSTTRREGSF